MPCTKDVNFKLLKTRHDLLGIDTGGTFTDFVLIKNNTLQIHKILSTPQAPEQAILQGMDELGLFSPLTTEPNTLFIVHGSTVATNAVLENKGVKTVLITNYGLRDLLTIGRQTRENLYDLQPATPEPPIPTELCLETGGRIDHLGNTIQALQAQELSLLVEQVSNLAPQAIAINLLFSFVDDTYEKAIENALPKGLFISRSSEVLPEHKEYERGMTTWLNASVGPIVHNYIDRLGKGIIERESNRATPSANLSIMQSSGGTIAASHAAKQAVHMLLSGPAGGLAGAKYIAEKAGFKHLLSFDMGGTSTDVALIDGDLQLTHEGHIGPYPVGVPMVDMHTIGAGGGSIATVDAGGLLQVGPQSAGADPGPACYSKGGKYATVTDANVVLGRIQPQCFLGGAMQLDKEAAATALKPLAETLSLSVTETALGIIQMVNEHMTRALRVMSVQRGIDPKALCLVSFGGAGALHVCALANTLTIDKALVPVQAGVLSALGMLVAPRSRHYSRSVNIALEKVDNAELEEIYTNMTQRGQRALSTEGVHFDAIKFTKSVDLRYQGQSYALTLDWLGVDQSTDAFHKIHEKRYGHKLDLPVELATVRLKAEGPQPQITLTQLVKTSPSEPISHINLHGINQKIPVYDRQELCAKQKIIGPALITEHVSTTYIESGWQCQVDLYGNLVLNLVES